MGGEIITLGSFCTSEISPPRLRALMSHSVNFLVSDERFLNGGPILEYVGLLQHVDNEGPRHSDRLPPPVWIPVKLSLLGPLG